MRTVADIMERDVFSLAEDATLARAAEALSERQISAAPVCSPEGHILGILSKTDLTEHFEEGTELVGDVMTTHVFAVKESDAIDKAIQLMAYEGVHRLLVLSEEHRLVGVVSSMDVLRELAGFRREAPSVEAIAPPER